MMLAEQYVADMLRVASAQEEESHESAWDRKSQYPGQSKRKSTVTQTEESQCQPGRCSDASVFNRC